MKKGTFGWYKEQAKLAGFDNIRDWEIWRVKQYNIEKIKSEIPNIDQIRSFENKDFNVEEKEFFYIFWSRVNICREDGCWNWVGMVDDGGYGRFNGKYVHRIAYVLSKGQIDDQQVQHICNNPLCCNPDHLELGDQLKNMQYRSMCGRCNQKGEHNSNSIFTEDQVRDIHKLYNKQRELHPEYKQCRITELIAKRFRVSSTAIYQIVEGKNWHHIYEENKKKMDKL